MVSKLFKGIIFLVLIVSAVATTIAVYSKINDAPKTGDMKRTMEDTPSVNNDISSKTGQGKTVPSVPPSSEPSSPSSGGSSAPSIGVQIGEIVGKVLKSNEELKILVSHGMVKEFKEYFKSKLHLASFNLSSEMEKAVADHLLQLCERTAKADDKMKRYFRKLYEETVEDKKKQFKEGCEMGPIKKDGLKGKTVKTVQINEDANESRSF